MSSELKRIKKRKETKRELNKIYDNSENALIIHYSCESFYDIGDGRTPRVTSIAIRNLKTAQTESFSIHKIAERKRMPINEAQNRYDDLEKEMLDEYFEYIRTYQGFTFIHWNMRDINYGFSAIEHRYQVLGGNPHCIDDSRKFDLARAMVALYGREYASHGDHGRLHSLIELNKITKKGILTGTEEAEAFKNAEYIKMHQSTLRKIDIFPDILERTIDGSLKTNATWLDRYGVHPKIILDYIQQHWGWAIIVIISVILGIVASLSVIF